MDGKFLILVRKSCHERGPGLRFFSLSLSREMITFTILKNVVGKKLGVSDRSN